MSQAEALRRARLEFGGLDQVKNECRAARGVSLVETLVQDLHYSARTLLHSPAFTACAVLTLALGIGANTAIFSVVNTVLLNPLPYPNPQELLAGRQHDSLPNLEDIQLQTKSFASSGGIHIEPMDFTGRGEPVRVHGAYVDAGFLATLGVQPMLGRWISPDEDVKGGAPNVVLSYPFWRDVLGSDPHVLGRAVRLSDKTYTVIGVMPRDFSPPRELADVFVSLWAGYPEAAPERGVHFMHTYWRLKPGVRLSQAQAEIDQADHRLAEEFPDTERERGTVLLPLRDRLVGNVRPALLVLFGAVGLVLLIACANFAMLLMARGVARQRELMIRASRTEWPPHSPKAYREHFVGTGRRSCRTCGCEDRHNLVVGIETGGTASLGRNYHGRAGLHFRIRHLPAHGAAVRPSSRMVCVPRRYRRSIAGERTHHRHWSFAQPPAQLPGHRGACPGADSAGRGGIADQRFSAPAIRRSGLQSREHHYHVPPVAGNPVSQDSDAEQFPPGIA